MVLAGLLIGLGGPFWYDTYRKLGMLTDVARGLQTVVQGDKEDTAVRTPRTPAREWWRCSRLRVEHSICLDPRSHPTLGRRSDESKPAGRRDLRRHAMTQGSLKKRILGDKFLTVTFDLADPGALSEPVGTTAFPLAVIEASTPTFDSRLFDRSFAVSAAAKLPVGIDIRAQHAAIDDVEGLGPFAAPSGTSYADFRLAFDVEVAGAGAVPTSGSGLTVGISAGGALDAAYRHLVPVSAETSRLRAVERVLGDSGLPQLLDLRGGKLLDGELHVLSGSCHLDLGLKGRLGGQFDHTMIVEAFDQAVDLLKARVAYSVDATLGYSLDRKMNLVVGRVGTLREGWVRVRLSAEKERRIAFSIVFALQVEYDLGHGLVALLDRIVELEPVTRLKLAMAKLAEVADRLEEPDQTWDVLKQELQGEAAQLIGSYLDDHGWLDRVAGSPELASAFAAAHRIVETYRGLDEKVEELWNQILAAGELGAGQRLPSCWTAWRGSTRPARKRWSTKSGARCWR